MQRQTSIRRAIRGLSLSFLVAISCADSKLPVGPGDVEPPGFDGKADENCACADEGSLEQFGLLLGVNRGIALKRGFAPETLEVGAGYRTKANRLWPLALGYFMNLADAAKAETGRTLRIGSAYRSFCTQCGLFAWYAGQYGEAEANTFSARAGHSEHQLATTIDIFNERDNFLGGPYSIEGTTDADPDIYEWLDEHAWRFGFMNSYPPNDGDRGNRFASRTYAYTKYIPEPWHWRFVGRYAAELHHRLSRRLNVRLSTHEFIDVLATPTEEVGQSLEMALAEVGVAIQDIETAHPDDAAALARLQGSGRCQSDTLGREIESGQCVQVTRAACGLSQCAWFRCEAGVWTCGAPDSCAASFPHAACGPVLP